MVKIYVNQQWMDYVGSFFGFTADFPPDLDTNNDGKIDITDVAWFAQQFNTWIELGTPAKPEKPTSFSEWWALRPSFFFKK